jgi:hypothetical protein
VSSTFDSGFFSFLSAFFAAFLSFLAATGSLGGGVVIDVVARDLVTESTALPERATTGRQLIGLSSRRSLYSFCQYRRNREYLWDFIHV